MPLMGEGLPKECRDDTRTMRVDDWQDKRITEILESHYQYEYECAMEMTPKERWEEVKSYMAGDRDPRSFWAYIKRDWGQTRQEVKDEFLSESNEDQSHRLAEEITEDTKNIQHLIDFIVCCYMGD